ncbi:MAG: hypothetical protein IJ131_01900, partial [Eggerthellaceae bacterium]|nr:hypothetical protein [Eggerthellaceae bacterium]
SIADGDVENTQNGGLANGLDMWIAGELRAAGFEDEQPWPRLRQPRSLAPALFGLLASSPKRLKEGVEKLVWKNGSSNAVVQGAVYEKQVDVGISSWLTGPELLISTKTMTREYGKNLKNRFEEAYGDAVNLRKRYPLASMGFFFLLNVEVLENNADFTKAVTMLRKLQGEEGVYDASALLLADLSGSNHVVSSENEKVPNSLSVPRFFEQIIDTVLVRGSMNSHRLAMEKAPLEIVDFSSL